MAGKGVAKLLDRCSFDGATLVHTDDGLLRIDQVRPGMSVLSGDPVTGNTSYQTVLDQYSNDYDKTVYITYEGADGPEQITSNTIHPFFVVLDETTPRLVAQSAEGHVYEGPIKGGAWVDAAHLRPGHNLRTPDGTLRKVLTVNITTEPLTAYNLTVDQTETYFVGEEPVWVHNCPDASKLPGIGHNSEQVARQPLIQHTQHSLNQKISREVPSSDLLDAIRNPLDVRPVKIDSQGRPSQRIVGAKAEVAINPESGKVVSVNPTSTRKAKRLQRKQERERKAAENDSAE